MRNIFGHTETTAEVNPGFIALKEEGGIIRAILRGRALVAAQSINMTREQLSEMGAAIERYLIDTEPSVPKKPDVAQEVKQAKG